MAYPERVEGEIGLFERWSHDRHGEAFAGLNADPEVTRFLGGPQSRTASDELSLRIADHWKTFGFGLWAVIDPDTGGCVGFSGGCHPGPGWPQEYDRQVELGWRLARDAWGRGLATEGALLAREHLDAPRIVAFVAPDNERSLAIVGRLGMQRERTVRNRRLGVDVDVYA